VFWRDFESFGLPPAGRTRVSRCFAMGCVRSGPFVRAETPKRAGGGVGGRASPLDRPARTAAPPRPRPPMVHIETLRPASPLPLFPRPPRLSESSPPHLAPSTQHLALFPPTLRRRGLATRESAPITPIWRARLQPRTGDLLAAAAAAARFAATYPLVGDRPDEPPRAAGGGSVRPDRSVMPERSSPRSLDSSPDVLPNVRAERGRERGEAEAAPAGAHRVRARDSADARSPRPLREAARRVRPRLIGDRMRGGGSCPLKAGRVTPPSTPKRSRTHLTSPLMRSNTG
jgi:hypothetical protein